MYQIAKISQEVRVAFAECKRKKFCTTRTYPWIDANKQASFRRLELEADIKPSIIIHQSLLQSLQLYIFQQDRISLFPKTVGSRSGDPEVFRTFLPSFILQLQKYVY
jgi:hypothetical protein